MSQSVNVNIPAYQTVGPPQVVTPTTSTAITLPANATGWLIQAKTQDVCISLDGDNANTSDLTLHTTDGITFLKAPNKDYFFYVIGAVAGAVFVAQPVFIVGA